MKKTFLLMILAVITVMSPSPAKAQNEVQGQRPKLTEEEIVAKRTDKMVQTLMLDDATAAKFRTVYSQYLKDKMACRDVKEKGPKGEKPNVSTMTDAQIEDMIQNQFTQSRKMLEVRENYYTKFRKILSPRQILQIYKSEKSDRNRMKNEFQKRNRQRNNRNDVPDTRVNFN